MLRDRRWMAMLHDRRWMAVVTIAAGLAISGCSASPQATSDTAPEIAKISAADSTGAKQVTLTQVAADRLQIQTTPVQETNVPPRSPGGPSTPRHVVPYSALIYDVSGTIWVYTAPEPLAFIRRRVAVDYVAGDLAVLSDGPPVGTAVVTVGAAELYGTEFNIGEPEHGE